MKNENKQAILDAFLFALWKTRAGYDIVDLQLTADQRTVVITYHTEGRAKIFRPAVARDEITARETGDLLRRAYHGSVGMMISAMAHRNDLSKEDIAQLYAILKEAEVDAE